MYAKFNPTEVNDQLDCAVTLPNIHYTQIQLQVPQRSSTKHIEEIIMKDKSITLGKMRQKLRKQVKPTRNKTIGSIETQMQDNPPQIISKTEDTSCISRIHTLTESPVFPYDKTRSLLKKQTFYPHKARISAEQARRQSKIKEKEKHVFSIKLLKGFLKNEQSLAKSESITNKTKTAAVSGSSSTQGNQDFQRTKIIKRHEMSVTEIQTKNSRINIKQELPKSLPYFIIKTSPTNTNQNRKKLIKYNPTTAFKTKQFFLSQRIHQKLKNLQDQNLIEGKKEIEKYLIQFSVNNKQSELRPSIAGSSLSAWQ